MAENQYDIITVGGGMAASSLAKAMAEKGYRVLVLEREREFKDRVRGEALLPWGVGEARKLGIYELLCETCAHKQPWFDYFLGPNQMMHRDLRATTPQQAPMLNFYHPRMQEVLITAAAKAGAEVRRGASVLAVKAGPQASVTVQQDNEIVDIRCRMVVVADGRVSPMRKAAGFAVEHDLPTLLLAGILLDHVQAPMDSCFALVNPMLYQASFIFPQGNGRARAYFAYPVTSGFRLQGEANVPRFIQECIRTGAPAAYFENAIPQGPLASFETADTWVDHPYKNGIALLGDAAASSDPSWGNGLSLALRGVRVLRDQLLATDDWDRAGQEYAKDQVRAYDVIHNVTTWARQIFLENGPEADARRAKAMPRIAEDPSRVPDHGISGPDIPFDRATAKARFFGEV